MSRVTTSPSKPSEVGAWSCRNRIARSSAKQQQPKKKKKKKKKSNLLPLTNEYAHTHARARACQAQLKPVPGGCGVGTVNQTPSAATGSQAKLASQKRSPFLCSGCGGSMKAIGEVGKLPMKLGAAESATTTTHRQTHTHTQHRTRTHTRTHVPVAHVILMLLDPKQSGGWGVEIQDVE